ncbi:hypothetical protein BZL29_2755 [Mycobacterium kansasii]|uniref:Lipoprotein n=1 Tax=Mycobacterium kansasii TaxID=1768 RepID=A0A1V3XLY7_MYCKA|nr:hypothetical protein BZL29_2755 [Mycobacterium kansasii]
MATMSKVVLALVAVCLLVGCSPGASQSPKADIAKVIDVKASFGPGSRSTTSRRGQSIHSSSRPASCPTA